MKVKDFELLVRILAGVAAIAFIAREFATIDWRTFFGTTGRIFAFFMLTGLSLFGGFVFSAVAKSSLIDRTSLIDMSWKLGAAIAVVVMAVLTAALAAAGSREKANLVSASGDIIFAFFLPLALAGVAFITASFRGARPKPAAWVSSPRAVARAQAQLDAWRMRTDADTPEIPNAAFVAAAGSFIVVVCFALALLAPLALSQADDGRSTTPTGSVRVGINMISVNARQLPSADCPIAGGQGRSDTQGAGGALPATTVRRACTPSRPRH